MFKERLKDFVEKNKALNLISRKLYSGIIKPLLLRKKKKLIKNNFDQILFDIAKLSSSSGVDIWPTFGTLLGIHRDNGPISHDIDIDFAAWYEQRVLLKQTLVDNGYTLKRRLSSLTIKEAYEEMYEKDGVEFDVFYFVKAQDVKFCFEFMRESGITHFSNDTNRLEGLAIRRNILTLDSLVSYKYKGVEIKVPENIEGHLAERYGEHFMKPDPNWVPEKNTDNIVGLDGYLEEL